MSIMMRINLELFCQAMNLLVSSIAEDLYSHEQDGKCGTTNDGSVGLNVVPL